MDQNSKNECGVNVGTFHAGWGFGNSGCFAASVAPGSLAPELSPEPLADADAAEHRRQSNCSARVRATLSRQSGEDLTPQAAELAGQPQSATALKKLALPLGPARALPTIRALQT
jgi:hypothetical protein